MGEGRMVREERRLGVWGGGAGNTYQQHGRNTLAYAALLSTLQNTVSSRAKCGCLDQCRSDRQHIGEPGNPLSFTPRLLHGYISAIARL